MLCRLLEFQLFEIGKLSLGGLQKVRSSYFHFTDFRTSNTYGEGEGQNVFELSGAPLTERYPT